MMRQHHAHDVMRAIESDRWAVRVTNTGISGIVTPHGNTLWLATPNTYITHLADITRRQTVTPYVRYGNRVPAILIGLAVIAGLIGHLRSTHILAERDKPL
jgi:apolipoprotein N-acyltransferase